MIAGFLDSELGVRVSRTRCDIEVPVLVRLGDVTVRGFADLLDRNSSPPLILDYKTNRLDSKSPAEKMDDYGLQRDLYGLAVAHAEGAESVETAFVFLEKPAEPVVKLLAYDDLDEARTRIRNLLGEIAGHDEVGIKVERALNVRPDQLRDGEAEERRAGNVAAAFQRKHARVADRMPLEGLARDAALHRGHLIFRHALVHHVKAEARRRGIADAGDDGHRKMRSVQCHVGQGVYLGVNIVGAETMLDIAAKMDASRVREGRCADLRLAEDASPITGFPCSAREVLPYLGSGPTNAPTI